MKSIRLETSRQGNPLWIVQEIEIWPYEQMVYAQPSICPAKLDATTPQGFLDTNGSPNLGQKSQQEQKKRTCKIVDFTIPVDHRVKLKESE